MKRLVIVLALVATAATAAENRKFFSYQECFEAKNIIDSKYVLIYEESSRASAYSSIFRGYGKRIEINCLHNWMTVWNEQEWANLEANRMRREAEEAKIRKGNAQAVLSTLGL